MAPSSARGWKTSGQVVTAAAAQYRAGQQKTFGFLVGQVMKGSGGKANPKLANELLKRELQQT